MGEHITENSAEPVTGHSGFNHWKRVISRRAPRQLWRARQARRGLHALRRRR